MHSMHHTDCVCSGRGNQTAFWPANACWEKLRVAVLFTNRRRLQECCVLPWWARCSQVLCLNYNRGKGERSTGGDGGTAPTRCSSSWCVSHLVWPDWHIAQVRKIVKLVINRKIGQANSHTSRLEHPQMSWMEKAFLKAEGGSVTSLFQDQLQVIPLPPKKGENLPGSRFKHIPNHKSDSPLPSHHNSRLYGPTLCKPVPAHSHIVNSCRVRER